MAQDPRREWLENVMARMEVSVIRLCYAYLGDQSLAEDAAQETFLKAWKSYDRYRGESSEKTWITRIAINTCKDLMKGAWFRHTDRSVTPDDLPEGSVPFDDRDDTVTRAVMALPDKLREVILLRWFQQLSLNETARALSLPRATVYRRERKAQSILKNELEEWYHAD